MSDASALNTLLGRCRDLCDGAGRALPGLKEAQRDFLETNLQDALQHLELILRVLDKETGKLEEPQGFLSRLARGFGKGEDEGEEGGGLPDLKISQQGLQGNSWTIPLSELIGFLAYGRKTGVLWVDGADENFLIGLEEGRLMHATSDHTPEGLRLGEILVGLGFLTRRQLERFLSSNERATEESELTGEMLLESGMISDEELEAALTHQVQHLFHRLIDTRNAIFRFREGMQVTLAYTVDLNIPQLLLESARVQDELSNEGSLKAIVGELASRTEESVPEDWDTWNHEMLKELKRMVLPEEGEGALLEELEATSDSACGEES